MFTQHSQNSFTVADKFAFLIRFFLYKNSAVQSQFRPDHVASERTSAAGGSPNALR